MFCTPPPPVTAMGDGVQDVLLPIEKGDDIVMCRMDDVAVGDATV